MQALVPTSYSKAHISLRDCNYTKVTAGMFPSHHASDDKNRFGRSFGEATRTSRSGSRRVRNPRFGAWDGCWTAARHAAAIRLVGAGLGAFGGYGASITASRKTRSGGTGEIVRPATGLGAVLVAVAAVIGGGRRGYRWPRGAGGAAWPEAAVRPRCAAPHRSSWPAVRRDGDTGAGLARGGDRGDAPPALLAAPALGFLGVLLPLLSWRRDSCDDAGARHRAR